MGTEMAEQSQKLTSAGKVARPAAGRTMVETLTPKEILGMLRQHIWFIVLMTIAGLAVGVLSWFLIQKYFPQYTATAYVNVLSSIEKDPTKIGQYTINRENQYVYRTSLASLITQQGMYMNLLEREKIQDTQWFKQFGVTRGGTSRASSLEKSLKDIERYLNVSVDRDSDFIRVAMTCRSPKEAALIANEMTDLFLKSRGTEEVGTIKQKMQALREQQASVQQELTGYQTALNNIRGVTPGFSDLEEHAYQDVITQKLAFLEVETNKLMLDISNAMAQMKTLERQATGPIAEQVSRVVESDPVMIMLNQQSSLFEAQLNSRFTKYGANHRILRQLQEQLDEINAKKQTRAGEIGELFRRSNLSSGKDTLDIMNARLAQLQVERRDAEEKKQKVDVAKAQYQEYSTKRDEAQKRLADLNANIEKYDIVQNDPETPKVKKAADAIEPLEVSFPRWELFFPGGTVLGLIIGLIIAILVETLNDLVRTARDVAKFLHISLLGIIPDVDADSQLEGIDPTLALSKSPYSIVSEAYRNLRSNLRLQLPATSKSILITSAFAGDGKTSVAVNLATSFAAQGRKVLLIDANFWRPKLNTIFQNPNSSKTPAAKHPAGSDESGEASEFGELGLSTVLTGLCGYHEVIRPSGIPNCDVVDSGLLAPNAAELLGSMQMEQFIKHQCETYDYVIIDGPPALLVGDVKLLARLVDGTILVCNAASTTRGAAIRMITELSYVNANVLGCVLFAVRVIKGGYFKGQFRAYQDYQKAQFAKPAVS
jgi:polysaccharide biosynthesis transport protein